VVLDVVSVVLGLLTDTSRPLPLRGFGGVVDRVKGGFVVYILQLLASVNIVKRLQRSGVASVYTISVHFARQTIRLVIGLLSLTRADMGMGALAVAGLECAALGSLAYCDLLHLIKPTGVLGVVAGLALVSVVVGTMLEVSLLWGTCKRLCFLPCCRAAMLSR